MRIANDGFVSRQSWWSQTNDGLLSETPTVSGGYVRHRLPLGGAGGSFHYDGNDGYHDWQPVVGDFDVCAEVQVLAYDELSLPPNDGNAYAYGIAVHNLATPETSSSWNRRDYCHTIISSPVSGGSSSARIVTEWKQTINSVSTWDTVDGYDDTTGRYWLRMARSGQDVGHYHAASDGSGLRPTSWSLIHTTTLAELRPFALVGIVIYSSNASDGLTGRCLRFWNT